MTPDKIRKIQENYRRMLQLGGGGVIVIVGATMGGRLAGDPGTTFVISRFCKAGNYVAAKGRYSGGFSIPTADGGLVLTQNNLGGLPEGIIPADGIYNFTFPTGVANSAAGGVIELASTGNSVAANSDNAKSSANPPTLTPAPANPSVGFAIGTNHNFVAFPSATSANPILGLAQRGTAGTGFETTVILAQLIPATPGTLFQATGIGEYSAASRRVL